MPVLDWSRTSLEVEHIDGAITTKFEAKAFAAFDLYILKRPNAEQDYNQKQMDDAQIYYSKLTDVQKDKLTKTVLFGLL